MKEAHRHTSFAKSVEVHRPKPPAGMAPRIPPIPQRRRSAPHWGRVSSRRCGGTVPNNSSFEAVVGFVVPVMFANFRCASFEKAETGKRGSRLTYEAPHFLNTKFWKNFPAISDIFRKTVRLAWSLSRFGAQPPLCGARSLPAFSSPGRKQLRSAAHHKQYRDDGNV